MPSAKQPTAFVYIDGQNVRGSARDYFGQRDLNNANLARIVESVVRGQRDLALQEIRYYSGVRPQSMPKQRSEDIVLFDRLASLGIKTFGNDLETNAVGKLGENGIDLKISSDMVLDFLRNPDARSFIVLSNDTDFEPTFDLLKDVAKQLKRDVDCAVITTGGRRGARNARRIDLPEDLYRRHCSSSETIISEAAERLAKDPETALDLGRHGLRPKTNSHIPVVPSKGKTGYYIDANTLGRTAKESFERQYLDANLGKLLVHVGKERSQVPAFATMFLSTHDPRFSLVDSVLTREIAAYAGRQQFGVVTEPFQYQRPVVARENLGAGSSVPVHACVPVEKRIETKILHSVVMDMLHRRTDDVVIVSDRRSLWPVADAVSELGKVLGVRQATTNVHFAQPGIDGMHNVHVDRTMYEEFVAARDLLAEAKTTAQDLVVVERDRMVEALRAKYPSSEVVVEPEVITGVVTLEGAHSWSAVDDGSGTIGVVYRLPMKPEPGVRYTVTRGSMELADAPNIERLQNLRRAQHMEASAPGIVPARPAQGHANVR